MRPLFLFPPFLLVLSACGGAGGSMNPPPDGGAQISAQNVTSIENAADTTSVLNQLMHQITIGSTIDPVNHDQNPYGLDIAQVTEGKLTAGDLVVGNFNNAANVQGTGTTIVALHPTPGSTPRRIAQSALLTGSTELAVDPNDNSFNAVFVENRVIVFKPSGGFTATLNGPWLKPFGITYAKNGGTGGTRVFYESDAGSGRVVRINRVPAGNAFTFNTIASGFPINHGAPGTELGPGGLQYDSARDRLYIVDGTNNTVYYFSQAATIPQGGIIVNSDGKTFSGPYASRAHVLFSGAPINGAISSALLFNGNLVIGNTTEPSGTNNIVEFSPVGAVLAVKNVDNGAAGAIFGMVATGTTVATTKLYFNDDNSATVQKLAASAPCAVPPTPTPGPVPAGAKLYVLSTCSSSGISAQEMTVYDENGSQIPTQGTFPNLDGFPGAITVDPFRQQIYVANTVGGVAVFGENGVQNTSFGHFGFEEYPQGIAFDTSNREFYITDSLQNEISQYDEDGNYLGGVASSNGLYNPGNIASDPLNRDLYIISLHNPPAFMSRMDENGNVVKGNGLGGFPGLVDPLAVGFDSVNRHLYVTDLLSKVGPASWTVKAFDENGDPIPTSGTFPNLGSAPTSIAFDPATRHLFFASTNAAGNGQIQVYDDNGNPISTTGGFPHMLGATSVVVVP